MANISKTLIVVEGGRLEPGFFEQLKKVFGLNLDLYCLEDNIYVLYNKMKEMGFNANLKDVLKEMAKDEKRKELLSQNFAYTYLIFDFDIHQNPDYRTFSMIFIFNLEPIDNFIYELRAYIIL